MLQSNRERATDMYMYIELEIARGYNRMVSERTLREVQVGRKGWTEGGPRREVGW